MAGHSSAIRADYGLSMSDQEHKHDVPWRMRDFEIALSKCEEEWLGLRKKLFLLRDEMAATRAIARGLSGNAHAMVLAEGFVRLWEMVKDEPVTRSISISGKGST